MSQCVEISSTAAISNPEPFLTRCLKAGVITLTLCTQGIDTLKTQAFPVNGKSVVIGNGLVFRTASVFLAVVPVFVAAGAFAGFGLTERAAVFLAGTPIVGRLSVFVHSKSGLTDRITGRKRFRGFRAAWIEGNKGRRIPSKKSSDPRPRGYQRRRQNRRCCSVWSARRAAAWRCSPPAT